MDRYPPGLISSAPQRAWSSQKQYDPQTTSRPSGSGNDRKFLLPISRPKPGEAGKEAFDRLLDSSSRFRAPLALPSGRKARRIGLSKKRKTNDYVQAHMDDVHTKMIPVNLALQTGSYQQSPFIRSSQLPSIFKSSQPSQMAVTSPIPPPPPAKEPEFFVAPKFAHLFNRTPLQQIDEQGLASRRKQRAEPQDPEQFKDIMDILYPAQSQTDYNNNVSSVKNSVPGVALNRPNDVFNSQNIQPTTPRVDLGFQLLSSPSDWS